MQFGVCLFNDRDPCLRRRSFRQRTQRGAQLSARQQVIHNDTPHNAIFKKTHAVPPMALFLPSGQKQSFDNLWFGQQNIECCNEPFVGKFSRAGAGGLDIVRKQDRDHRLCVGFQIGQTTPLNVVRQHVAQRWRQRFVVQRMPTGYPGRVGKLSTGTHVFGRAQQIFAIFHVPTNFGFTGAVRVQLFKRDFGIFFHTRKF